MIYKNTTIFLLILASFLYPVSGFTSDNTNAPSSQSQGSAAFQTKTALQQIIVFARDQTPLTGYVTGVKSDTLIILSESGIAKVTRSDLIKVIILKKDVDRTALNLGILLGLYIGNIVMSKAEDQPTAFLLSPSYYESPEYLLLSNLGFLVVGGFVGTLFSPKLTNEVVLDFTDNEQENRKAWKRIENIFYYYSDIKRIHFNINSSYLYLLATNQHREFYRKYAGTSYTKDPDVTRLNLIRKIQFTYNLKSNLELGPTLAFLGEPFGCERRGSFMIEEQLNNIGYYFSLSYYPFNSFQNKNKIYWNIGLSLGAVDIDYSLAINDFQNISRPPTISKWAFSTLLSSEIYFTRTSIIALGLQADYAFIPQQRLGAVPEIGLPAKYLNFSNGGLGILFKINF